MELCTGCYKLNPGLTCAHKIKRMLEYGEKIALRDIHLHWYYFRTGARPIRLNQPMPSALMQIHEPATVKQGRRRSKQDDNSTRRLPLHFELLCRKQLADHFSSLTALLLTLSPTLPSLFPVLTTAPSTAAPIAIATGKKLARGPDKQPCKERTFT